MKAYIATGIIGTVVFDEKGKLLEYKLFSKSPEEVAREMERIRNGEILNQEKNIAEKLKKKYQIVCDREIQGIDCVKQEDNIANDKLKSELRKIATELKWGSNAEINQMLSKVNILLTKEKLKITKSDKILMQAITTLDEIDKVLNVFSEKIREWYGLYFPEATRAMDSNEKLVKLVADFCDREKIQKEYKDKNIIKLADRSAGMELSDYDLESIQKFSKSVSSLFKTKKEITGYVEKTASEVIPNMSAILGYLLASRMLAAAGGLEKMAKMPSSTIQLIGAEKALFRHLKDKSSKAPKFGLLFAHPYIQQAPKELKGKAARIIAAKLFLAVRTDFFSKKDKGKELKKELEEQIKRIMK